MSSVCRGSIAGAIVVGADVGATAGVVAGGDTEVPLAGIGEDGTEAAPAQTSTAMNPRLRRRPHDECQARPNTPLPLVGAPPSCPSSRSPATAISPQPTA
ncbi:MAG TPA: hypothetical protein VF005_02050, partial [Acidimicrobiales bacterium]